MQYAASLVILSGDYNRVLDISTSVRCVLKESGRISKRMLQENRAHQIFWKTNSSYPLIRTRIGPFALLPTLLLKAHFCRSVLVLQVHYLEYHCDIDWKVINCSWVGHVRDLRSVKISQWLVLWTKDKFWYRSW